MNVGPMWLIEDSDSNTNDIEDCWKYGEVLLSLPAQGAQDYCP